MATDPAQSGERKPHYRKSQPLWVQDVGNEPDPHCLGTMHEDEPAPSPDVGELASMSGERLRSACGKLVAEYRAEIERLAAENAKLRELMKRVRKQLFQKDSGLELVKEMDAALKENQ